MPLFKSSNAPNATISINIGKDSFVLGETIAGNILVTSEEEFEAKEIRVELQCVAEQKIGPRPTEHEREGDEVVDPRVGAALAVGALASIMYKKVKGTDTIGIPMFKGQTKVSEKLKITKGYRQQFPFQITIQPNVRTMVYLSRPGPGREWTLKGVIAVEGRPNVETKKDIKVSLDFSRLQKNRS